MTTFGTIDKIRSLVITGADSSVNHVFCSKYSKIEQKIRKKYHHSVSDQDTASSSAAFVVIKHYYHIVTNSVCNCLFELVQAHQKVPFAESTPLPSIYYSKQRYCFWLYCYPQVWPSFTLTMQKAYQKDWESLPHLMPLKLPPFSFLFPAAGSQFYISIKYSVRFLAKCRGSGRMVVWLY